jgi:hypothetical protein
MLIVLSEVLTNSKKNASLMIKNYHVTDILDYRHSASLILQLAPAEGGRLVGVA